MIEAMKMALEALELVGMEGWVERKEAAITALRQAIYEAEFDKAFDEYAESDEGKARIKMVFKQSAEHSVDALIEHIKTRQQEAK
jgi:hypothetical protein